MSSLTVSGNMGRRRYRGAGTDFPLYLPRPFQRQQELKFVDTSFAGVVMSRAKSSGGPSSNDYFSPFSLPTAGDGLSFRLADRIQLISLSIRGNLSGPSVFPVNVPLNTPCEYFVIYDRFPSPSALPLARQVFTTESIANGSGLLQLPESRDRFEILYRFRYLIGALQVCLGSEPPEGYHYPAFPPVINDLVLIDEHLEIGLPTSFRGSGGSTYEEICSGALYLYKSASSATPFDDEETPEYAFPRMHLKCRLLFADL